MIEDICKPYTKNPTVFRNSGVFDICECLCFDLEIAKSKAIICPGMRVLNSRFDLRGRAVCYLDSS